MHAAIIVASLSAMASAQILTPELLDTLSVAPIISVPMAASKPSQTTVYDAVAASAGAYADTLNDPKGPSQRRAARDLRARTECTPLPQGYGSVPQPDDPEAFLQDSDFSDAANNAQAPSGWLNTYQNQQAATSTTGYLGYNSYQSYDPAQCAADCNGITGCLAFNIFFERAPTIDPGPDCSNPSSTTLIKCSFWGDAVEQPTATNNGQWRNQFQVVIAGSNGYQKTQPTFSEVGYTGVFLDRNTINAPTDCDSYLTVKTFSDGQPYDPARCAAACNAETNWAISQNSDKTCQFFTSYLLLKNGITQFQACALYKSSWDTSYAVNNGYYYGSDHYTIEYSYAYSNTSIPGTDSCSSSSRTV